MALPISGATVAGSAIAGGGISTLGAIAVGSMITGGVLSALGAHHSAKMSKYSFLHQARMGEINAKFAALSAQDSLMQAHDQIQDLTREVGLMRGLQRLALAAHGVAIDQGSALELRASTDIMAEIDKSRIMANAIRSGWGHETRGLNAANEARLNRATATGISPGLSAVTSAIGSLGDTAALLTGKGLDKNKPFKVL